MKDSAPLQCWKSLCALVRILPLLAATALALPSGVARADSGPLTFTVLGGTPTTGSNWGSLTPPTSVTFSDTFTTNSGTAPASILDNWTFSVPSSAFTGTTITGEQINFSNFTLSGVLDTVSIYAGTVGSATLLKTWAPATTGTYSGVVNYTITAAGNYYLQVAGTQAVGTVGGYSGVFVAATAVPEPANWLLVLAGFGLLGLIQIRRRR